MATDERKKRCEGNDRRATSLGRLTYAKNRLGASVPSLNLGSSAASASTPVLDPASVPSLDPGENRRRDATSVNATDAKRRGGSRSYCSFDNNNINNVDKST